MNTNHYQVVIKDGKYPKEFACVLFLELHLWRYKWWFHITTQRGPLFKTCRIAHCWSAMFKCSIIDKTIEL